MPYIDINLGRIIAFGDIIKFVEKLKSLKIEEDTPVYIVTNNTVVHVRDMGANSECIVFSDKKLK